MNVTIGSLRHGHTRAHTVAHTKITKSTGSRLQKYRLKGTKFPVARNSGKGDAYANIQDPW